MITFNYNNADSNLIGRNGINIKKEFKKYHKKIEKIITSLNQKQKQKGEMLQWLNLANQKEVITDILNYTKSVKNKFENILVLGIGGSALGGIALTEILNKPYWNLLTKKERNNFPRIFFIDNIDPDIIYELLSSIDLSKTLVNVITKSGSTAETIAQFMILKDKIRKIVKKNYQKHFVITTTTTKTNTLLEISKKEGYKIFSIPEDVGGRFSFFSPVGLLPCALVGIDINKIIKALKNISQKLQNTDLYQNISAQYALINFLMNKKKKKNIFVFMPYSSRLKSLNNVFIQLIAESLGKKYNKKNKKVFVGPTPISAIGATDQHAQNQLFHEGPKNKIITFIKIKQFAHELKIPKVFTQSDFNFLCNKTINQLLNTEADACQKSFAKYQVPTMIFEIQKIDETTITQLMYILELQTAIMGELYAINYLNQPGVEMAKKYTYKAMGKKGYENFE